MSAAVRAASLSSRSSKIACARVLQILRLLSQLGRQRCFAPQHSSYLHACAAALKPAVRRASQSSSLAASPAQPAARAHVERSAPSPRRRHYLPNAASAKPLDDVLTPRRADRRLSLSDECLRPNGAERRTVHRRIPADEGRQRAAVRGAVYPRALLSKSLFAVNYAPPANHRQRITEEHGRRRAELQFAKPKATMDDDVFVKRAKMEATL